MTAWLKMVPAWAYRVLALVIVAGSQQLRVAGAVSELAGYKTEVSERDRRATLASLQETKRRMLASEEVQKDAEQQLEVALLMPIGLALLLSACSKDSTLPNVAAEQPAIQSLPSSARQQRPMPECVPTCSVGLARLLDSMLTSPTTGE